MRTAERLKESVVAAVAAVVVEIAVVVAAAAEFDVGSAAAAGHDAAMNPSRWWETWAVVNS